VAKVILPMVVRAVECGNPQAQEAVLKKLVCEGKTFVVKN
jgi:hypothetical protein